MTTLSHVTPVPAVSTRRGGTAPGPALACACWDQEPWGNDLHSPASSLKIVRAYLLVHAVPDPVS